MKKPSEFKNIFNSVRFLHVRYGYLNLLNKMIYGGGRDFLWMISRIKNRLLARYVKNKIIVYDELGSALLAGDFLEKYLAPHNNRLDA